MNIDNYNTYSAAQISLPEEIPFASSITLNFVNANNFNIGEITSDFTLENPSNLVAGAMGYIRLKQDVVGGWQPTMGSSFYFSGSIPAQIIDPTPNSVSTLEYRVASPTEIHLVVNKNWVNS